jgi:hypothetical protein
VLKIAQFLLAVSPRLLSKWFALHLGVLCGAQTPRWGKIYWRFIGGFCPMGDNLGRVGQSVHFMQIEQSRINTGYFAFC